MNFSEDGRKTFDFLALPTELQEAVLEYVRFQLLSISNRSTLILLR